MTVYKQIKDLPVQTTALGTDKVALQTAGNVTKYSTLTNIARRGYMTLNPTGGSGKGANAPADTLFRGNHYVEAFAGTGTNNILTYRFQLPNDYVEDTSLEFHVLWALNVGAATGAVKWKATISYARGFGYGDLSTDYVLTFPDTTVNTTAYTHMISDGGTVTKANLGGVVLRVGGVILVTLERDTTDSNDDAAFFLGFNVVYTSDMTQTVEHDDAGSGFTKV